MKMVHTCALVNFVSFWAYIYKQGAATSMKMVVIWLRICNKGHLEFRST